MPLYFSSYKLAGFSHQLLKLSPQCYEMLECSSPASLQCMWGERGEQGGQLRGEWDWPSLTSTGEKKVGRPKPQTQLFYVYLVPDEVCLSAVINYNLCCYDYTQSYWATEDTHTTPLVACHDDNRYYISVGGIFILCNHTISYNKPDKVTMTQSA